MNQLATRERLTDVSTLGLNACLHWQSLPIAPRSDWMRGGWHAQWCNSIGVNSSKRPRDIHGGLTGKKHARASHEQPHPLFNPAGTQTSWLRADAKFGDLLTSAPVSGD